MKYRGTKFDPTTVKYDVKKPAFNEEHKDEENGSRCMVSGGNGTNQLIYFTKKKTVDSKFNYHNSNKELFDWDSNLIKMHQTGQLTPQKLSKDDPRSKNVFHSTIFDDTPNQDVKQPNKHKSVQSCFVANGDVFTWKGNENCNQEQKAVKRRDPNQKLQAEIKIEKNNITKTNKMFASSKENVLNHH